MKIIFSICICFIALTIGLFASKDSSRALGQVRVASLPKAETNGNVALFVGVGNFDQESGLSNLRYTSNDAINLAHLFAMEISMVPVDRTWVAISGDITSPVIKNKMDQLKLAGAHFIEPTKINILRTINKVSQIANNSEDLVLMTVSTHGFEKDGHAFVMPSDGDMNFISSTGVSMETIKSTLRNSKAQKRILIIDACRETPVTQTRGSNTMNPKLEEALKKAEGMAILSSCSYGQLSWESSDIEQGVFTHHLIEGIRGGAKPDPDTGLIDLGSVSTYATEKTYEWVNTNKGQKQTPWFEGERARQIPLAIDVTIKEQLKKIDLDISQAFDIIYTANKESPDIISGAMIDSIRSCLNNMSFVEKKTFLQQLEVLQPDSQVSRENFRRYWEQSFMGDEKKFLVQNTSISRGNSDKATDSIVVSEMDEQGIEPIKITKETNSEYLESKWKSGSREGVMKLHILPLSFSKESQKQYGDWIKKMGALGYGNAVWQELEEMLYDHPKFELITQPTEEDEFLKILGSYFKNAEGGTSNIWDIPAHIITMNCNFFVREEQSLKGFKATKAEKFHVTIYMRYYDLTSGRVNQVVPSSGSVIGDDPISASREAAHLAMKKLMERLKI
jgi:hypothetical protein